MAIALAGRATAQELAVPGLAGSWEATQALVTPESGDGVPLDALAAGGGFWLTVDPDSRFVVTTRSPGGTELEASADVLRFPTPATIEFGDGPVFTFTLAGDTLTLAGAVALDLDGDGALEPSFLDLVLARGQPLTGEGQGIPGAWVRAGGHLRTYDLYAPTTEAPTARPLLLMLHGMGDTGAGARNYTGLDALADELGFLVAYPDGFQNEWAAGCACTGADRMGIDDVAFVRGLVAQLAAAFPVDTARVYVTGFSQGAMLSLRLACEAADLVAAVAPVHWGMPRAVSGACAPARPIPVVYLNATGDQSWPGSTLFLGAEATARRMAQLNGCVGEVVEPLFDTPPGGLPVTLRRFTPCHAEAEVLFYAFTGGGHFWPGEVVRGRSGSRLIAEQLLRSALPPRP